MTLALDIGNSGVKGGIFDGSELLRVFSVSTEPTPDEHVTPGSQWTEVLSPHLQDVSVNAIGLTSVVPKATKAIERALAHITGAPVTEIQPTMALPFELAYETPGTLGTDRLAAAAAGWVRFGQSATSPRSVLVIDAGTAVTVDVIHRDGIYKGGTITAGPALVRQALGSGTAQLPEVPLALPDDPVGHTTTTALQSGIMWGLVDGVRGLQRRLADTLPGEPVTVLTGGWSDLLDDHLSTVDHHARHLVLEGIRILIAENRSDG